MADCTLRTHPYLISVKSEERRVKFPFVCAATFTRMSPAIFLCTLSAVVAQVSLCCRDYKGADSWKWWEQLGGITGWFAWTWQCHCVEPFPCFSLPSISPSSTYTWPIHHHWEWIKSMALSALPCKTFLNFEWDAPVAAYFKYVTTLPHALTPTGFYHRQFNHWLVLMTCGNCTVGKNNIIEGSY